MHISCSPHFFISTISMWLLLSSGIGFSQNMPLATHSCGQGDIQCVKQIAEEVQHFAESFRSAFIESRGVSNYTQAVSAVRQDMKDDAKGYLELFTYSYECVDGMANLAKNPAAPLRYSFEHIRPNLENCIRKTVNFSNQLNVPVDKTEAARLRKRVDEISKYFKANPPPMNQRKTKQGPPII